MKSVVYYIGLIAFLLCMLLAPMLLTGCATLDRYVTRDAALELILKEAAKLAERKEAGEDIPNRYAGKRNVLAEPGNLITWYTPDEKQKRVMQYDSGYYHPNTMNPAAVAAKHWDGISRKAESVGHAAFRQQSSTPVAYCIEVLSWWEPRGTRAPNVTLHEIFYDKGYSIRFEVGNSRDHFGAPGSAHGYIVGPDGAVVIHMDVNHNRETSLRY